MIAPIRTDLRPVNFVMSSERLIAAYPSALSFTRSAVAHLAAYDWTLKCLRFDIDAEGVGTALYRMDWSEDWVFHFLVVSKNFPSDQKTDRSFGENWDISAALCEGAWSAEREAYLLTQIPRQRAGRFDYDTLVTLRGNRSGRIFNHVVENLAVGRIPDAEQLAEVGYIVRTTGLIANGALGMRPFEGLCEDHPFVRPYYVQMVSAMLLREFVFDLVDDIAAQRGPKAIRLPAAYKRYLGVGNAAGAGLVAYIAGNPMTVDRWVDSHERVIAKAWETEIAPRSLSARRLAALLKKAIAYFLQDGRDGNKIFAGTDTIVTGLQSVQPLITAQANEGFLPVEFNTKLRSAVSAIGCAAAEVFQTILVEILPDETLDTFRAAMLAPAFPELDFNQTVGEFHEVIRRRLGWALDYDFSVPAEKQNFWYRSAAAALDPRRGIRGLEPGGKIEWRMDTAWRTSQLECTLSTLPAETSLATVLASYPAYRDLVRRIQALDHCVYGEVIENRLAASYTPFAAMRLKLSFYGMDKLDPTPPKSVRGALLQGAPTLSDLTTGNLDGDWPFPLVPRGGELSTATQRKIKAIPIKTDPLYDVQAGSEICSPVEMRRLVSKSLQGAGLSLGVSDVMADSIERAELWHSDGFDQVAALLEAGKVQPLPITKSEIVAGAIHRASGLAAISLGSAPIELACAAATSGVTGRFRAYGVTAGRLLEGRLLDGQISGSVTILIWSELRSHGVSVFVPTDAKYPASSGLVSVVTENRQKRDQILEKICNHPVFLTVSEFEMKGIDGVQIVAVGLNSEVAYELDLWSHVVTSAGPSAVALPLEKIAAVAKCGMRQGLQVAPATKAVIEAHSKAVLMPAGTMSDDVPTQGNKE